MRRRRYAQGFSLIELLVVIGIMGLLATIVAINLGNVGDGAKQTRVAADFSTLRTALEFYKLKTGKFPRQLDDLTKAQRNGDKIMNKIPRDPWDHEYAYLVNSDGTYLVKSFGSDGEAGGTGYAQDLTTDNIDEIVK